MTRLSLTSVVTVVVALFIGSATALAQREEGIIRSRTADLSCAEGSNGRVFRVINAASTTSCTTERGDATALCWCACVEETCAFIALAPQDVDLSEYAALSGAEFTGSVSIVDLEMVGNQDPPLFLVQAAYDEKVTTTLVINDDGFDVQATGSTGSGGLGAYDGGAYISDGGSAMVAAEGGALTATSENGCLEVQGVSYCHAAAYQPYMCSGGGPGLYFDTDDGEFCYCDGTAWGPVDAASSATCTTPE